MTRRVTFALAAAIALSSGSAALAQDSTLGAPSMIVKREIDGRVARAFGGGLVPMPGLQVTLHRIGPEGGHPIDSSKTRAGGRYRFDYKATGSDEAVYLVSVSWSGITYFSTPTRQPEVQPGDADITVYDTTSAEIPMRLVGHHLVVAAPLPNGDREVAEVFEIGNDTSVTRIAKPNGYTFITHVPGGAQGVHVTQGDIATQTVHVVGEEVRVDAPISPGLRQLALQYTLPPSAFPLSIPIEQPTGALELLVEEPGAIVSAPGVRRVPSVALEGRTFARYLAQDVQANGVIAIAAGAQPSRDWTKWVIALAVVAALAMITALAYAFRGRRARHVDAEAESPTVSSHALVRRIAELDAAFEASDRSAERTAEYERERALLKAQLASQLAAERARG